MQLIALDCGLLGTTGLNRNIQTHHVLVGGPNLG